MTHQTTIELKSRSRGFHIITRELTAALPELPETGVLHLFIQHTSAALCINESADPAVLTDFETVYNNLVPEGQPWYEHREEGPDDMPAHIKSAITGSSISIPISDKQLNLGTWQGIYLCEFRNNGGTRKVVATLLS